MPVWREADHPRDPDGRWTDTAGSRRAGLRTRPADTTAARAADVRVTAATDGGAGEQRPTRTQRQKQLDRADPATLRQLMDQYDPGTWQSYLDEYDTPPPRSLAIGRILSGERRAGLLSDDAAAGSSPGVRVRDQDTARRESAAEVEYRAQVKASEDRRAELIAMGRPALVGMYEAITGQPAGGHSSKQWLASGIVGTERRLGLLPQIRSELVPERVQRRIQREAREDARRR